MFWTRVASALIFGVLVVLIVLKGGLWVFFALVSVVAILSALEFFRLTESKGWLLLSVPNALIVWLFCLSSLKPHWIDSSLVLYLAIGFLFLIEIIRREPPSALLNISSALLGILYIGWLFGWHLIQLRQMQDGHHLILLLSGIIWSGDIGAYLVGKRFGKHRPIPAISPGKSVEGYMGGIILSVITAMALGHWLLPNIRLLHTVTLGVGLTVVGQIGDLAESLLKRGASVKDSGSLMPGHGGLLDRCDSMIFAAPALYYYIRLMGL